MTTQQAEFRQHIEELLQQGQMMLAIIACTNYIDNLERQIDEMLKED